MGASAERRTSRRLILAGLSGNALEWYDFAVYGYFAATIGALFFPNASPGVALLLSFATFGVGFLARPLGGLFFGYIGDRYSRRRVLVLSSLLMAVPTTTIGLLPTWEQIGIAAPILLVLLRLLQGASVGGELAGSVTYLVEQAPVGKKARFGSIVPVGAFSGILLGSGVAALLTSTLSSGQLDSWGWRIAFIGGSLVGTAAFLTRRLLTEEAPRESITNPLGSVLRHHRKAILLSCGLLLWGAINFYIPFVYLVSYEESISGLSDAISLEITSISLVVLIAMVIVGGWLGDRFGPAKVIMASAGTTAVLVFPLFWLVSHDSVALVLLGQIGLAMAVGPSNGVMSTYVSTLFPAASRVTGFSVVFNTMNAIFGGSAALVAALLVREIGPYGPAFYLFAAASLAVVTLLIAKRYGYGPPVQAPTHEQVRAQGTHRTSLT